MPRRKKTKDDTLYSIEKILNSRKRGKKTQYLIKWETYGPRHNSWEPEENLCGCDDLITEYLRSELATRRAASELKRSRSVGRLDSNCAARKKPRRSQSVANINCAETVSIKRSQSVAQLNTAGNVSTNRSRSVACSKSESCANRSHRMRTRSMARLDLIAENPTENHQCTAATTENGQRRVRSRSASHLELIEQEERKNPKRSHNSISTTERGRSSDSLDSTGKKACIEKRKGRRTRSACRLDSTNSEARFRERSYERCQSVNALDSLPDEMNFGRSFEGSQSFTHLDTIITDEDDRERSPGFTGLHAIITNQDYRERSPRFPQEDRVAEGRHGCEIFYNRERSRSPVGHHAPINADKGEVGSNENVGCPIPISINDEENCGEDQMVVISDAIEADTGIRDGSLSVGHLVLNDDDAAERSQKAVSCLNTVRAADGRRKRKRSASYLNDKEDRKRCRSTVGHLASIDADKGEGASNQNIGGSVSIVSNDEENSGENQKVGCADAIETAEVKPDESPSTDEKCYRIYGCQIRDKDGRILLDYDAEARAGHRRNIIDLFEAGWEVERIIGASTLLGGDLKFVVKFKEDEELILVPRDVAHERFPIMLIDFYESSLRWE